jgi:succinate dehydrogenase / fumarate reductase flavoprotein subunit
MIRTLQDYGIHQGIDVYMECTITRLLKDADRVAGAFGYFREDGRYVLFTAKAIVLATGGTGRAYPVTSNSWEYTGDGDALAYEAGAELIDMEFIQFHPTGMVWPPGVRGLLVTEGVRGEGGILRNAKGERFMFKYLPETTRKEYAETEEEARRWVDATLAGVQSDARRPPELSTRDNVSRSIYTEVKEGRGSPHGGVFLDVSYLDSERVKKKLPSMYHQFKDLADVDITKVPMEVGPTMHYTMGGVKVDADTAQSCVPGLFAAGEVAAGLHGANRLGGNSLSDLIVFGQRAGLGAANYVKSLSSTPKISQDDIDAGINEMEVPLNRTDGLNPYQLQSELHSILSNYVGIFRVEDELAKAVTLLEELGKKVKNASAGSNKQYNPGWHLCKDMKNMLICAQAIAKGALERKESRGAHSRLDYPNADDSSYGTFNLCAYKDGEQLKLKRLPVPEMPPELKELLKK